MPQPLIDRTDAGSLIPEEVSRDIVNRLPTESAALALFRRVTMSRKQQRIPVLSALPTAGFVNGDTGLKAVADAAWQNKFLNAEELAVIVPIPEAVLDDADFDIFGEVRPLLVEALGRTLDNAIFFGVNKPASWPADIKTAAVAAGNSVTRGTAAAAAGGIAEDINQLMGKVEADGFAPNAMVAPPTYKSRLRTARDTTGQKLLDIEGNAERVWGLRVQYAMPGLWPSGAGAAEMFVGDFAQGVLAIRQDLTWKVLTEAVIQNADGTIAYNLPQQDMVALRVVMRVAWQVPNPITYDQATEANRYPFGVMVAP